MREIFVKTVLTTGECTLSIATPNDRIEQYSGRNLLPDGEFMDEKEITPTLLHMLAEAYYAGYREAVYDSEQSVRKLLSDSKQHHKPSPKIGSVINYKKEWSPSELD